MTAHQASKTKIASPFAPLVVIPPVHPPVAATDVRPIRLHALHRHIAIISLFLFVFIPTALSAYYLFVRAADQYVSTIGFVVRGETTGAASLLDGVAGLSALGGSTNSDVEILREYLGSTSIVTDINATLDLHAIWGADGDPIFSTKAGGTVEDLHKTWGRMVRLTRDTGGLIALEVNAFSPQDAYDIANAIRMRSDVLVNALNLQARNDLLQHSTAELDVAKDRLREARQALAAFRARTQIIDPMADIGADMGLLSDLQQRLMQENIELELLKSGGADVTSQRSAQVLQSRTHQTEKRIEVIEQQILAQKERFSAKSDGAYPALLTEYERLTVNHEFAQKAYTAALTAYELARMEAQKKTRYLAVYDQPTLAQRALYPKRTKILLSVAFAALLLWAFLALCYASFRDRIYHL